MSGDIAVPDEAFFERMRDYLDSKCEWFGMHEDNTVEQLSEAFGSAALAPEEPRGKHERVRDREGDEWARVGNSWVCEHGGVPRDWSYLVRECGPLTVIA